MKSRKRSSPGEASSVIRPVGSDLQSSPSHSLEILFTLSLQFTPLLALTKDLLRDTPLGVPSIDLIALSRYPRTRLVAKSSIESPSNAYDATVYLCQRYYNSTTS